MPLTSAQLDHPSCLRSFSTVLLQLIFGCPVFLLPSGCHSIATMQSLFLSFLSTCSIQCHLLPRISSLILFTPVISVIVSFWTRFGHHILWIFLKLSCLFSSVLVIFQSLYPYSSTGRTSVSNRLIFQFCVSTNILCFPDPHQVEKGPSCFA